jgi:hypothetical protein
MSSRPTICLYFSGRQVVTTSTKQGSCNKRLIFLVFGFFLLVNIISSGGHFDAWDGVETFLVTESMVLKHSAKLYPDVPSIDRLYFDIHQAVNNNKPQLGDRLEPVYTVRSLLLSAIAVPFYYAALLLHVSPIPFVALFVNSLIISLTCVVVFCFSLEVYNSRKISFVSSLIFGVCSFIWPYNTSLFPQPLQTLCIFTSAYFIYVSTKQSKPGNIIIRNRSSHTITTDISNENIKTCFAGLAGLFLGLSVLAHPPSALVIPGFIAYSFFTSRGNRKTFASFLIVLAIMVMFILLINYWKFGSISEFGYGPAQPLSAHSGWNGLVGLIVSTGAGLIFFFPIAILFPLSLRYFCRENRWLFFISIYVFVVFWFFFGTISYAEPAGWSGAGGWGPRYLLSILPFIALSTGSLLKHFKKRARDFQVLGTLTIILCTAGFTVNLLGTLVWYEYGYDYGWSVDQLWKVNAIAKMTGINSMDIMTWNPSYSPIILHAEVLASGHHPQLWHDARSYGLAPCAYDLYLFCKFGPIPMLIMLPLIAVLGIIILNETRPFKYVTLS